MPSALKALTGVKPYRINSQEPDLASGDPEAPPHVVEDPVAYGEWQRIVAALSGKGVLKPSDAGALAVAARQYSIMSAAREEVRQHGLTIQGYRGYRVTNPAVKVERDATQIYQRCLQEFGLTPSARSRLVKDAPEPGEASGPARLSLAALNELSKNKAKSG